MESERIELSAKERERLKVLHQVEQGHLKQIEAARRLRLSDRQVRRLQRRLGAQGDGGIVHRLRQAGYAGFGPTLAAEHLARSGMRVSRETLRKWMSASGLWRPRNRRVKAVHVWRPRRAGFGELVLLDSSPYRWRMKELLEAIARALVNNPDHVQVRAVEAETVTVLELRVHPSDMGRVIGREGCMVDSIRTIIAAAGIKLH